VNPQFHDEFIALCALFFAGELSDEEWALLQVHLAYCDSCRSTFTEFQRLHETAIPAMAAAASAASHDEAEAPHFSLDEAEQRLIRQLNTLPAHPKARPRNKIKWALAVGLIAATALGATWLSHPYFSRTKRAPALQASAPISSNENSTRGTAVKPVPAARPSSEIAQVDADKLREKLNAADARYKQLTLTADDMQQQLEAAQVQEQETTGERDALRQQLAQAQSEVQTLRAVSARTSSTERDQAVRLVNLQTTVQGLSASLDVKSRMLALDKQFLDHDREIRDLIAARHLYIADIYDVNEDGETAKPFGRIFYTKDKSLVFYGYDLDRQTRHKESVAFQVWGSGDDQPDVSLGLFSRDGKQKIWILHFNNTKTLARLNKVFVTVEPRGGSNKPTGKEILMAYLRIQPNHP
jgi:hypothetical protein